MRNKGALLKPEHLILGKTSKLGGDYRGQYGEGFKLGMMALCRIAKQLNNDVALVIHTGNETWVPTIHFSSTYNTDIIRVNTYERKDDGFLQVEIPNITLTDWLQVQERILCLGLQKKFTSPDGRTELLLDEKYKNQLFCKGLYVSTLPMPSKYGYNLSEIKLDRDRKMADDYSMKSSIARLLAELNLKGSISSSEILKILGSDEQLLENAVLRYYPQFSDSWSDFKKNIAKFWKELHGENAIPISTAKESQICASLGQVGINTNRTVIDFLGSNVLQLADVSSLKAHEIKKVYELSELSDRERHIVGKCDDLGQKVRVYSLRIVDFAMPDLMGLCHWQERVISVSKRLAEDYTSFMSTLIHEMAHLNGHLDQSKGHMDEATNIAAALLYLSNKDVT